MLRESEASKRSKRSYELDGIDAEHILGDGFSRSYGLGRGVLLFFSLGEFSGWEDGMALSGLSKVVVEHI